MLADDSTLFRTGLAGLLTASGLDVTAQVKDGSALLAAVAYDPPDAVIVDIRMPPTFTDEGLIVAERLRRRHPSVGVLVLSTYAQTSYAVRLLSAGAHGVGYLLKDHVDDLATISDALRRVSAGESVVDSEIVVRLLQRENRALALNVLTLREREVLRLIAEGRSNVGIGQQLHLSAKTVEAHVGCIFVKLGLNVVADDNRRVLAALAWLRSTATNPR